VGFGEFGNLQMVGAAQHLLRRAMIHPDAGRNLQAAFVGCCALKTIGSSRNRGQLNRGASLSLARCHTRGFGRWLNLNGGAFAGTGK
jgi:hypothetical protein